MGKIISFSNQKGGVGKTTTCVNMAAYLSRAGKKVLLIDLDPQGNATTGLGFSKGTLKKSVYNVVIEGEEVKDNILETELEGLYILPSNIDLAGAEVDLVYKKNRDRVLKAALEKAKGAFDYILIDCPPSLGLLTINALSAADSAIIPIQSEYYALEGLSQLMNTVRRVKRQYNDRLEIEGVLLTMYDGRLNLTQQVVEEVKKYFPRKVFSSVVPRGVRLAEAPSFGKPIQYFDRNCKGAAAYNSLADEILRRG